MDEASISYLHRKFVGALVKLLYKKLNDDAEDEVWEQMGECGTELSIGSSRIVFRLL